MRLPVLKPRELERILLKLGFTKVRQKGSHAIYKHPDGRLTVIPFHTKDIPRPLLAKILKDINITPDELLDILKK